MLRVHLVLLHLLTLCCAMARNNGWPSPHSPQLTGKLLARRNASLDQLPETDTGPAAAPAEKRAATARRAAVAVSCRELKDYGRTSGFIPYYLDDYRYVDRVFCDGEWVLLQKRVNGDTDFYRGWEDYKRGFGHPHKNFWLGLEKMSQLTSVGKWNLHVKLTGLKGHTAYATYSEFRVGPENTSYTLHIKKFLDGKAGDSLSYHNGQPFTTKDRDNDNAPQLNCAVQSHGAWWYKNCFESNLNGNYEDFEYGRGINWLSWRRPYYSLPFAEMKMKRV